VSLFVAIEQKTCSNHQNYHCSVHIKPCSFTEIETWQHYCTVILKRLVSLVYLILSFVNFALVEVACFKLLSVHPKSRGQYHRNARPRPYADPYSTLTEELPGDVDLWSDTDEEARKLIYSNSMSDIVSSLTRF